MILFLRTLLSRWRFARMTADIDRRIKAARRAHGRVRHLLDEKRALVHSALAGRQMQSGVGG